MVKALKVRLLTEARFWHSFVIMCYSEVNFNINQITLQTYGLTGYWQNNVVHIDQGTCVEIICNSPRPRDLC
jgi:hypothetical protein